MKAQKTVDQILYGEGTYASALPMLMMYAVSDAFDNLITRLVKKIDRRR